MRLSLAHGWLHPCGAMMRSPALAADGKNLIAARRHAPYTRRMDTLRRRLVLAAPVAAFAFLDAASETEVVVDRFFAAYQAMDVDAIAALLAPGVVFEDPTFGLRAEGREAVRKMAADIAARYTNVSITTHGRVIAGDRAATEQTVAAAVRTAAGDRRISVRGASFFEVSGNVIRRWTDYYDVDAFRSQMTR